MKPTNVHTRVSAMQGHLQNPFLMHIVALHVHVHVHVRLKV